MHKPSHNTSVSPIDLNIPCLACGLGRMAQHRWGDRGWSGGLHLLKVTQLLSTKDMKNSLRILVCEMGNDH